MSRNKYNNIKKQKKKIPLTVADHNNLVKGKNTHSRSTSLEDGFGNENTPFLEDYIESNSTNATVNLYSSIPSNSITHRAPHKHTYHSLNSTIGCQTPESILLPPRITANRVTAYCRAKSYKIKKIQSEIQSYAHVETTIYDECLYIPNYGSDQCTLDVLVDFSLNTSKTNHTTSNNNKNAVFVFDYGVVVTWNMSLDNEYALLKELDKFAHELLVPANFEMEEFSYFLNPDAEPSINNDLITIKSFDDNLVQLAFSHAISQSSKLSLFENFVEKTINNTKHIPQSLAEHGIVNMSRTALSKKIGQLFIMRVNVSLVSNILDTPDIFWSEPGIQPIYEQALTYLELSQRVNLLNHRVGVIGNMLEVLRNHVNGTQGEFLEWIVILLIAFDIVVMSVETLLFYLQH